MDEAEAADRVSESMLVKGDPYRYLLARSIDAQRPLSMSGPGDPDLIHRWLWILLNPSTADEVQDDPTTRKVAGFTRRWGGTSFTIVNLFAYRATKPAALARAHRDGIDVVGGSRADQMIREAARNADRVVCGWGANVTSWPWTHQRVRHVGNELLGSRVLYAIGRCKGGAPQHPLMAKYTDAPIAWRIP